MSEEAATADDAVVLGDIGRFQNLWHGVAAKANIKQRHERVPVVKDWYSLMVRKGALSDRFKLTYYITLAATSLVATAVPTLIAAAGSVDAAAANLIRIVAAVLGVLVAVATSVLGVVQVGNRWRVNRTLSIDLEDAGWQYLASEKNNEEAFSDFFKAVNWARHKYGLDYLSEVAVLREKPQPNVGSKGASLA